MLRACAPTTAARKPKIGEILAELPKVSECHLNNPKIVGSNSTVVVLDLAETRKNKEVYVSRGSHTIISCDLARDLGPPAVAGVRRRVRSPRVRGSIPTYRVALVARTKPSKTLALSR